MNEIKKLFSMIDKRWLPFIAIAIIVVIFCFYKALGAFSATNEQADFERRPAPGLATAPVESIIKVEDLKATRLPDDAFIKINTITRQLSPKVAATTITPAELVAAGMTERRAAIAVNNIRSNRQRLSGLRPVVSKSISLDEASATTAGESVGVNYLTASGENDYGTILKYSYRLIGSTWRLDNVLVSLPSEE